MTKQMVCGALVERPRTRGTTGGTWGASSQAVRCQLPIEGYGDCAACGLSLDEYDHAPAPNRHPYQPSQWRHVGGSGSFVDDAHHPATPATAEEGVR